MFSLLARLKNRKATAYALFLGMTARDGGLGEENLKQFVEFVHPSTLQKYDHILSVHSNAPLIEKIEEERLFIDELAKTMKEIENLTTTEASSPDAQKLHEKVEDLCNNAPPMLTTTWDNLNIRGYHRHERINDKESCQNLLQITLIEVF